MTGDDAAFERPPFRRLASTTVLRVSADRVAGDTAQPARWSRLAVTGDPGAARGPAGQSGSGGAPCFVGPPAAVAARSFQSPTVSLRGASAPSRLRDRILGSEVDAGAVFSLQAGYGPQGEQGAAAGNAVRLAGALLFTTSIGYGVGILVARFLGTDRFGRLAGAEARAALILTILSLGVDTYTLLEVSRRPGHAREFVPGVLAFRAVASALVALVVTGALVVAHQDREAIVLFLLYAGAQLILQANTVLAACLQAVGRVKGIPISNLVAKSIWGLVIIGGIKAGFGARSVPIGWIVGESVRFSYLSRRTGRELGLRLSLRGQQVRRVLKASLPFTVTGLVAIAAQLLDVNLLSFVTTDRAVGYYRNAQNLASIAFFVGTVLPWVFTPLISRAAARSADELQSVTRRGFELVMVLAIPGSVLLALNADVVVSVSGSSYAPSAPSLRILSIVLIATYVIMVAATVLQVQGRSWAVVRVALAGVVVDAALLLAFVPMAARRYGDQGAGVAAAFSMLAAEITASLLLVRLIGSDMADRRALSTIAKTILAGVPVVAADRFMAAHGFSWVRLLADVVLYGATLLLTKVLKVEDVTQLIRQGLGRNDATTGTAAGGSTVAQASVGALA